METYKRAFRDIPSPLTPLQGFNGFNFDVTPIGRLKGSPLRKSAAKRKILSEVQNQNNEVVPAKSPKNVARVTRSKAKQLPKIAVTPSSAVNLKEIKQEKENTCMDFLEVEPQVKKREKVDQKIKDENKKNVKAEGRKVKAENQKVKAANKGNVKAENKKNEAENQIVETKDQRDQVTTKKRRTRRPKKPANVDVDYQPSLSVENRHSQLQEYRGFSHCYNTRNRSLNNSYDNPNTHYNQGRACPILALIFSAHHVHHYMSLFTNEEIDIYVIRIMEKNDFYQLGLNDNDISAIRGTLNTYNVPHSIDN